MSDAIKARQEQVELCRDLLLSAIQENLTLYRQAILRLIDEHNSAVPPAAACLSAPDLFNTFFGELSRNIGAEVTDMTSDVLYAMSHAIEEEDADSS